MTTAIILAATSGPFGTLISVLDRFGPAAVFLFVVCENMGVPIPGETMLVLAAAYASTGALNLGVVVGACAAGVFTGSLLSYLAGRRGGMRLLRALPLRADHLERATGYMQRWGGPVLFIGRYIAFLRSYLGWLAGLNGMALGPFLVWNLVGSVAWTLTFAAIGAVVGTNWTRLEQILRAAGLGGAVLVAALIAAALAVRQWRRRGARAVSIAAAAQDAEGPAGE